jgi:hypothetical protein
LLFARMDRVGLALGERVLLRLSDTLAAERRYGVSERSW